MNFKRILGMIISTIFLATLEIVGTSSDLISTIADIIVMLMVTGTLGTTLRLSEHTKRLETKTDTVVHQTNSELTERLNKQTRDIITALKDSAHDN